MVMVEEMDIGKEIQKSLVMENPEFCVGATYTATKVPVMYIFPEKKLRGLSSNFHIHVSLSDLNIPRIGPHISLQ